LDPFRELVSSGKMFVYEIAFDLFMVQYSFPLIFRQKFIFDDADDGGMKIVSLLFSTSLVAVVV
jgi:hypothetical protein